VVSLKKLVQAELEESLEEAVKTLRVLGLALGGEDIANAFAVVSNGSD